MRKESSAAERRISDFAPKLVDLTDRVRFREVWKRHGRSQRDRRLVNASPVWEGSHEGPGAPDVAKLARLIGTYAPHDGRFALGIPGVHAIRASRPYTELVHTVWQPGLCIVAQGAKQVMLGQHVYEYDESRMLVSSVEVPVAAQVTRASRAEPYLCLRLDFDPQRITELVWKVYPHGVPRVDELRAVYVGQTTAQIVNAATRLVELMAQPGDAELLAPLVIDEILIRLLRSPGGARVAQIGLAESRVQRVAKALSWLRANFAEPMQVEALAKLVHMSASAFHQHFKAVTSMSPLQYQKVLRLQEARRLMLSMMMDVSTASLRVGYLSVSQFSREYNRFFGSSPTKDIARLREHLGIRWHTIPRVVAFPRTPRRRAVSNLVCRHRRKTMSNVSHEEQRMKGASKNKRHRTVCGLVFFLSVLQGFGSVVYATESPSSEAKIPNQATLIMLAKIAAAGASGQFNEAEQLFRQGKEAGLSEPQMYETVLNLLPYIGYPRTLSTMSSFQKVYPHYIRERSGGKDPQPTEPWQEYAVKVWVERGAQIQQQLGVGGAGAEELTKQLTLLSLELTEWVRYDDFGRVFGRAGLSLIEREAIVIGVLVAQGAPQIASHHRAMLRVGGSEALIDSLVEAVAGIVDAKAVAAARRYIAEVRKQ